MGVRRSVCSCDHKATPQNDNNKVKEFFRGEGKSISRAIDGKHPTNKLNIATHTHDSLRKATLATKSDKGKVYFKITQVSFCCSTILWQVLAAVETRPTTCSPSSTLVCDPSPARGHAAIAPQKHATHIISAGIVHAFPLPWQLVSACISSVGIARSVFAAQTMFFIDNSMQSNTTQVV